MGRMTISILEKLSSNSRAETVCLSWKGLSREKDDGVHPCILLPHPVHDSSKPNPLTLQELTYYKKVLTSLSQKRKNGLGKSLRLQLSFHSVLQTFSAVTAAENEESVSYRETQKKVGWVWKERKKSSRTFVTQMVPRCLQLFHHLFLVIHYASSLGFSQMLCID